MRTLAIFLAFIALTVDAVWAKPPPRYVLQDLGTLPGHVNSYARRINDRNQIIGSSEAAEVDDQEQERAFLWEEGAMNDLGTLPGNENSWVFEINDRGQIIGAVPGAYLGATPVEPPAGHVFLSAAYWSLNDQGAVAGTVRTFVDAPGGFDTAFVYQRGSVTLLPALSPGGETVAVGINNRRQLLLHAQVSATEYHPVLYSGRKTVDLATRPGVPMTEARAINIRGHVAGYTTIFQRAADGQVLSQTIHPCLYRKGRVSDLGLLPNTFSGESVTLNDRDEVVGVCSQAVPNSNLSRTRPFLFTGQKMYDLEELIGSTDGLTIHLIDINNHGWIVGSATRGAVTHAILLRPVRPTTLRK